MQALIPLLIQFGIQYGIPAVLDIIALLKKQNVTLDDVEALFTNLKPYSAYNIPDVAPTNVTAIVSGLVQKP